MQTLKNMVSHSFFIPFLFLLILSLFILISQGFLPLLFISIGVGVIFCIGWCKERLRQKGKEVLVHRIKEAPLLATQEMEPLFMALFGRSAIVAIGVTLCSLAIGYLAYFFIPQGDEHLWPAFILGLIGGSFLVSYKYETTLFETAVSSLLVALYMSTTFKEAQLTGLPLTIGGIGVITSFLSLGTLLFFKKLSCPTRLRLPLFISMGLLSLITFFLVHSYNFMAFEYKMAPFYTLLMGLLVGPLLGSLGEYYTSHSFYPVKWLVHASEKSLVHLVVGAISFSLYATLFPTLFLSLSLWGAYEMLGHYGMGLCLVSFFATMMVATLFEEWAATGESAEVVSLTPWFAETANGLRAWGRGYALGTGAFVSLTLFVAYTQITALKWSDIQTGAVIIGPFLGTMLPLLCAASLLIKNPLSLSRAPLLGVLFFPPLIYFVFGKVALGGFVLGTIVTSALLSLIMENFGRSLESVLMAYEEHILPRINKNHENYKFIVLGNEIGLLAREKVAPFLITLMKWVSITAIIIALGHH